jgi:hypothetical protein
MWGRVLKWIAIGAVALELFYVVVVNAGLSLGVVQKLFAGTDTVKVNFASAWSVWPGTVHVRKARVLIRDHNVESSIDLERGVLVIELADLAHQVFHTSSLHGSGLVYRFRHHVMPESANLPAVKALPPIKEFPDPPVFEAYAPEAPTPDGKYHLWTVYLEGVDVLADEVWIEQFRYLGAARATGAFRLRPAKHLWVGPASLYLGVGKVLAAGQTVLDDFAGRIDCIVQAVNVEKVTGMRVLAFISANVTLSGKLAPGAAATNVFVPEKDGISIRQIGSRLLVDAAFHRGVLESGSRLAIRGDHLDVTTPDAAVALRGPWEIAGSVVGSEHEGRLVLDAEEARVNHASDGSEPAVVRNTALLVTSSSLDIMQPWTVRDAELDVLRAAVPDVRLLNGAMALGAPRFRSGAASFRGRVHYAEGSATATWKTALQKVVLDAGDARLEASAVAALDVASGSVEQGSGVLAAHVEGGALRVDEPSKKYVSVRGFDAKGAMARVGGASRGFLAFRMPAFEAGSGGSTWTARASLRGDFADESRLGREPHASTAIRFADARMSVDGKPAARAKLLEIGGLLRRVRDGTESGTATVAVHDGEMIQGTTEIRGSADLDATLDAFDPERSTGTATVRLKTSAISLDDATRSVDCPFAHADSFSTEGRISLFPDSRATAYAEGVFKNVVGRWGDFTMSGDGTFASEVKKEPRDSKIAATIQASSVRLKSGSGPPADWSAELPRATVQADVDVVGSTVRGPVTVTVRDANAAIGRTTMRTDVNAAIDLSKFDLDDRSGSLSGHVQVLDAAVRAGDRTVTGWWADLAVSPTEFTAMNNLDFTGRVHAKFRDALPALHILAHEDKVPKWLPGLLPLNGLAGVLDVRRECRLTDVGAPSLSGGPLSALGHFQTSPGATRAAVLVRLAALEFVSVGVALDQNDADITLFAGKKWLAEHSSKLDAILAQTATDPCPPTPRECSK